MIATSPTQSRVNAHHSFNEAGFAIIPHLLSGEECDTLSAELTAHLLDKQELSSRTRGGLRNILKTCPLAARVAGSPRLLALVEELTGATPFPVRGIFFDKTAAANWSVPWHQDLAIAVAERIDTPGFGPWSVKEGIVHVQPTPHILADMIAVRLHLDDCAADNGALRVIPGSHTHGELSTDDILACTTSNEPVVCEVARGGALAMRPLLLHASSPAVAPSHRRVLHLEYASAPLPNGLRWFEQ